MHDVRIAVHRVEKEDFVPEKILFAPHCPGVALTRWVQGGVLRLALLGAGDAGEHKRSDLCHQLDAEEPLMAFGIPRQHRGRHVEAHKTSRHLLDHLVIEFVALAFVLDLEVLERIVLHVHARGLLGAALDVDADEPAHAPGDGKLVVLVEHDRVAGLQLNRGAGNVGLGVVVRYRYFLESADAQLGRVFAEDALRPRRILDRKFPLKGGKGVLLLFGRCGEKRKGALVPGVEQHEMPPAFQIGIELVVAVLPYHDAVGLVDALEVDLAFFKIDHFPVVEQLCLAFERSGAVFGKDAGERGLFAEGMEKFEDRRGLPDPFRRRSHRECGHDATANNAQANHSCEAAPVPTLCCSLTREISLPHAVPPAKSPTRWQPCSIGIPPGCACSADSSCTARRNSRCAARSPRTRPAR